MNTGDDMFSFDLKDGFYAMGIILEQRDFPIVNVRGQLYRLAFLPMGDMTAVLRSCDVRAPPSDCCGVPAKVTKALVP
jgi:hypothetical protein